ncbi:MAG: sodium/proline symporter PutP [Tannerellaceae bacterium]|jgi:sodium/proline symporter|nr:sodium/proline symporter PutP [Tannerellaceae bacterium]
MEDKLGIYISFFAYMAALLVIGGYFYKISKSGISSYFLGGREMGPWVTALSAQASDMSAWLFMSLPAAAYLFGYQACWIAIGLIIGTYLNWKIVARRIRNFSYCFGDSITIPEYLQKRFQTNSPAIRFICSAIVLIFFLLYVASGFSAESKLFEELFGLNYRTALFISALTVLIYTFLGGFRAVCWTDAFQSLIQFFTIIIVPIILFGKISDAGISQVISGEFIFGTFFSSQTDNFMGEIVSGLGWGLGYFGMPHILVRFMAIRSADDIRRSRIIAMAWVSISLCAAVAIGILGKAYLSSQGFVYENQAAAERIYLHFASELFYSWMSGILLSGILAAVMSTVSAQLLVVGSAMVNDLYMAIRKNTSEKKSVLLSRVSIFIVTGIAILLAWFPESTVMGFVSYAWAGFGATFSPVILLSILWKRLTLSGALAGMVLGGISVILWESVDLYSITGYSPIVPCFIFSTIVVIAVSLWDKKPSADVTECFDKASKM